MAEHLVDAETGEILVEAGTVMTRSVIDSISEQLDSGLNKITYIPNDSAVLLEPVELQKFKVVAPTDPDRVVTIIGNANPSDKVRTVTPADILAEMSYFLNLATVVFVRLVSFWLTKFVWDFLGWSVTFANG